VTSSGVIDVRGLTKRYGARCAVEDLTFTVRPGRVTGLFGPHGAGKTTTLRLLLGLVRPTAGTALIGGRRYAELADPLRTVGAVLEAPRFHPGRTGRDHLRVLAAAAGIPERRVGEVLRRVGLAEDADRKTRTYSMGMRRRLALAAALLGDPGVLILDEPGPRGLLRWYAGLGRTVLVTGHAPAELARTVDDVLVIRRGRLVCAAPRADLADERVRVRTPDADRLRAVLLDDGVRIDAPSDDVLYVTGTAAAKIGHLAHANGIELHELTGGTP